jgi:hypothetical protein
MEWLQLYSADITEMGALEANKRKHQGSQNKDMRGSRS